MVGMVDFMKDLFSARCLLSRSLFSLKYLEMFAAKDIQSRCCRNLREMKDVFKDLRFWVEKGKVALHKINKDILEIIFTRTIIFNSTVILTILRVDTWLILESILESCFRRSRCFYLLLVFPHT